MTLIYKESDRAQKAASVLCDYNLVIVVAIVFFHYVTVTVIAGWQTMIGYHLQNKCTPHKVVQNNHNALSKPLNNQKTLLETN